MKTTDIETQIEETLKEITKYLDEKIDEPDTKRLDSQERFDRLEESQHLSSIVAVKQ
jgi:hypothetical protein